MPSTRSPGSILYRAILAPGHYWLCSQVGASVSDARVTRTVLKPRAGKEAVVFAGWSALNSTGGGRRYGNVPLAVRIQSRLMLTC